MTTWTRVSTGFSIGQPYLDRASSPYREWYVLRIDARRHPSGKQRYERIGPDRQTAIDTATHLSRAHAAGAGKSTVPLVTDVLDAWYLEYVPMMKQNSRKSAKTAINLYLAPYFAGVRVTELSMERVWAFAQGKIEGDDYSPEPVGVWLGWLARSMNLLWEGDLSRIQWTPQDQCPGRRIQKVITACKSRYAHKIGRRDAFSPEEARTVLTIARESHPLIYPMLRLGFGAGMRKSEIRALQWDSVDLDKGVAWIRRNFSGTELSSVKTGARGVRFALLPPGCVAMLRQMSEARRGPWVCPAPKGGHITDRWFHEQMTELIAEAVKLGVRPGMTFHSTRHTFVSQGSMQSMADAWLEQQVGHSAEMRKHYRHLEPSQRPDLAWADFDEPHCSLTGITGADEPHGTERVTH